MNVRLTSLLLGAIILPGSIIAQYRVIDGHQNPSLITDTHAYACMLGILSMANKELGGQYKKRIVSYAHWIGLNDEDAATFVAHVQNYDLQIKALDSQASELLANKPRHALDLDTQKSLQALIARRAVITQQTTSLLSTTLTDDGRLKLAHHITERVKPSVVLTRH